MDVLKQIRNDFFGEDYKKYILIGFQKYFENQIPMSVKEKEKLLSWLDEKSYRHVVLSLGNRNEKGELHGYGVQMDNREYMYKGEFKNGKKHGWFKYYLNRKFEGRGYAINGEIFFHFVVHKDDGSVEYYE
jgi:hypothetical protein